MGGCCSVSISCDRILNLASQWIIDEESYIHNLEDNLSSLEGAIEELKAKRDDLRGRIKREEDDKGLRMLSQLQVWFTKVDTIEKKVNDILDAKTFELQKLCLCEFCSKNPRSSHRYGKMVFLMLKEVDNLKTKGVFEVVAEPTTKAKVEERPIQATIVGQKEMFEHAWSRFMDNKTGVMGVYGMGGVGKTTILTRINNCLGQKNGGGFDIVIWVTVSEDSRVGKIQDDIGEKLGLSGDDWSGKKESLKAIKLYNILKRKKIVLLLDDLRKKIDFEEIGIPFPTPENSRKIADTKVAFTTRSREVCAGMGVHDPLEVQCLSRDDSWILFQKKVGEKTLKSDPDIKELANKIVDKCGGLPLALNVIGETMACKTTAQEWDRAVYVLTSSASEFSRMEDDIFPILRFSYDSLKGEQIKSCFQYCALFPKSYLISKDRLIDYWICEGFIDENEDRENNVTMGYEIIGTLVHACLLMEDEGDKRKVKMHDLVREMALWVASELEKHKENFVVKAGFKLRGIPTVKNWNVVRRVSLMCNDITDLPVIPKSPELVTLFLQENHKLQKISEDFFKSMPRLVVLDLSKNSDLVELPDQVEKLFSLRYLDLSDTPIKHLPIGIRKLKNLIHLNLESTWSLETIIGISGLSSLKFLGLKYSALPLDQISANELQLLDHHLDILTLDVSSILKMKQLLSAYKLVSLITDLSINNYLMVKGVRMPSMDNCHRLRIRNCVVWEIKIDTTYSEVTCFPSLSYVHISECHIGLKDLTWLKFAPNLSKLTIVAAKQLEYIISKEKAKPVITPFQKLKFLQLHGLPMLKDIYWSPLPFPCLRNIDVRECPTLKKLPLDSKSAMGQELVIEYGEREWIEKVGWEDQAAKDRFLPSCQLKKAI